MYFKYLLLILVLVLFQKAFCYFNRNVFVMILQIIDIQYLLYKYILLSSRYLNSF